MTSAGRFARWTMLLPILGLGATCSDPTPSNVPASDCRFVGDPRVRWERCRLVNYTAVEESYCFCPPVPSWTVVVRGGQVVDAIPDPSFPGDPVELRRQALARAWTVEQMFERIDTAKQTADRVFEDNDAARGVHDDQPTGSRPFPSATEENA